MAPDAYSKSSLPQAMAAINMVLLPSHHQAQDNLATEHNVTINDQILIRVSRDKSQHDDSYSPTPEGIHQDNTEISSVTLIGRYNVTQGGESRLWSLETPTGNCDEDDFRSGSLVARLCQNSTQIFMNVLSIKY